MFYVLAISVVIFSGCNFSSENGENGKKENSSGELVVNNQSSVDIKEIKFCSQQFYYTGEGSDYTGSILPIGKKTSVSLTDEETGYVFFTLLLGIDSNNRDIILTVRTNDIVTVEKGRRVVVTITDNTLVVITGRKEPSILLNLMIPAVLQIENMSYDTLTFPEYNGEVFISKDNIPYLRYGDTARRKFYGPDSYTGTVYFRGGHATINDVKIERGMITRLIITSFDTHAIEVEKLDK